MRNALLCIFLFLTSAVLGQQAKEDWIQRQLSGMSLADKVGQLLFVQANLHKDSSNTASLELLVRQQGIGGVIFKNGGPTAIAIWGNKLQHQSRVPLLLGSSLANGFSFASDSALAWPSMHTMGALGNDSLMHELGAELARQHQLLGLHFGLLQMADLHPNGAPASFLSFGSNAPKNALKAAAIMKGMQRGGVYASLSLFASYANEMPAALADAIYAQQYLGEDKGLTFRRLSDAGLFAVAIPKLLMPAQGVHTTASDKMMGMIRNEAKFQRIAMADLRQGHAPQDALQAIKTGFDMLLLADKALETFKMLLQEANSGALPAPLIEQKVRKILEAKYDAGLASYRDVPTFGIAASLNHPKAKAIKLNIYKKACTLVRNQSGLVPFQRLDTLSLAALSIGASKNNRFFEYLDYYAKFDAHEIASRKAGLTEYQAALGRLSKYEAVIVSIHGMKGARYGIDANMEEFVRRLSQQTKVVVVAFGHPYSLPYLNVGNMVCAHEEDLLAQEAAAQALFGAVANQARLPFAVSEQLGEGQGSNIAYLRRLAYGFPEEVGMDSYLLHRKVDSLMEQAIRRSVVPGGQVLFAKDGLVVFNKSYGHYTYSKQTPVNNKSVYDLASLTKVLSTTQAVMKLEENQLISLDGKVGDYLPDFKGSNKANLVWKEIMTHQAGLQPFVPHFDYILNRDGSYKPGYLSFKKSEHYPNAVADGLYSVEGIADTLKKWTVKHPLRYRKNVYRPHSYRYSDIGFYLLMWAIERQTGKTLDRYVDEQFYKPLGLSYMTYKPLEKMPKDAIVPTEFDSKYRKSLLQGYVDDPGAALIGGVGGHAGLFSNANDVAIIMQMNLQNGYYGGQRLLKEATVKKFNTQPYSASNANRRAIGWDKPWLKGHGGATSPYTSHQAYGHTGFTGTSAWADPTHGLVYVFLSNRIHPYIGNSKIITEDLREHVMSAAYQSMGIKNWR